MNINNIGAEIDSATWDITHWASHESISEFLKNI